MYKRQEVGYLKSPINLSMITELNSMNIGRALDNKGEGIRHFHGDIAVSYTHLKIILILLEIMLIICLR